MNLEQLKAKITSIAQMDGIVLNVFFILKVKDENDDETLVLKRADIKEDVKTNLIDSYKGVLNGISYNEDISLVNISEADDRKNVIYNYDLEDHPGIFDFFNDIADPQDDIETFKFADDDLANLEGYFVRFGDFENYISFYRKQMPINLFKRGKIYLVKGDATQFESIDKEFLRIDSKIDVIKLNEDIFINNISILERHYEFKDIIEKEAELSLAHIDSLKILGNIQVLIERVSDTTFARKLSKISTTSPVFNLEKAHIMAFVRAHPKLGTAFNYSANNEEIMLDTKTSQNTFLKLMNDDFLHSELTDFDYVTPAKDKI